MPSIFSNDLLSKELKEKLASVKELILFIKTKKSNVS